MDIKLNYVEKGEGFPLVLLHGNGEDHTYFSNQTEYFSEKYKVIVPDTRGHGKSPRGGGEFTINRFADDLHDFLSEKNIDRAILLGFSDGANVALTFALKYPECVEKLVLNGGNLNAGGVKRSTQLPIEIGHKICGLFAKRSQKARLKYEMLDLMVNQPDIAAESLKTIVAPTLVIVGTNDMIKDEHSVLIYKSIPGARLVRIKGDHFIANKKPAEFNAAVDSFLNE